MAKSIQKTITVFICPNDSCKKEHSSESSAERCCRCDGCSVLGVIHRKHDGDWCDKCFRKRARDKVRRELKEAREQLARHQRYVENNLKEIARLESELVELGGRLPEQAAEA